MFRMRCHMSNFTIYSLMCSMEFAKMTTMFAMLLSIISRPSACAGSKFQLTSGDFGLLMTLCWMVSPERYVSDASASRNCLSQYIRRSLNDIHICPSSSRSRSCTHRAGSLAASKRPLITAYFWHRCSALTAC